MATVTSDAGGLRLVSNKSWKPRSVVWEITLACNLRCGHCGSRAGEARDRELSTVEALRVAGELADLGAEVVTLAGGEPTVRDDWDVIARALVDRGVYVNMITNGVYRSHDAMLDVIQRIKTSGMGNVGVSIDGPEDVHDSIRGRTTFRKAMATLTTLHASGIKTAVLTTVSKLNLQHLEAIHGLVVAAGVRNWRLQLAVPMGNMDGKRDVVLRPEQVVGLMRDAAALKKRGGVHVMVADNIGYYGPFDKVLREFRWSTRQSSWRGCQAGMNVLGIEADGDVKGCLALQAKRSDGTDPFVEGNLREETLEAIWHKAGAFAYNREMTADQLTGGCAGCKHGELCRGGARCMAAGVGTQLLDGVDKPCLTETMYCYQLHAPQQTSGRRLLETSAAAAAALLIATAPGCGDEEKGPKGDVVDASDTSAEASVLYGVPADTSDQDTADRDMNVLYGVPEDTLDQPLYGVAQDTAEQDTSDMSILYGVPSDTTDDADAASTLYGVPADTTDDGASTLYGVPPDTN